MEGKEQGPYPEEIRFDVNADNYETVIKYFKNRATQLMAGSNVTESSNSCRSSLELGQSYGHSNKRLGSASHLEDA